jgi:hypothetical protein
MATKQDGFGHEKAGEGLTGTSIDAEIQRAWKSNRDMITTIENPTHEPQLIIETIMDIIMEYGAWCIENNRTKLNKSATPDLQAQPSP